MNGYKLNKKKVQFIAEIASSHNGSKKNLINLINFLVNTEVDLIKIQVFKIDDLAHKTYKFYKILKKISLNFQTIDQVLKILIKKKKKIILEPFDYASYLFCKKYKDKVYLKISSSENDNEFIFKDALINFKKIFLSISGKNIISVKKILKENKTLKKKLVLTYGFQSFPTNYKDLRLSFIKKIKKINHNICYADHTSSKSISSNLLVILKSIEQGANYIEKHVTLNRFKNYPDSDSSLDLYQFKEMLNFFKQDIPLKKKISFREKQYSVGMKKYAVTIKDIKKNKKINYKDIKFLRTNIEGINISNFSKLNKLITKKKLKKNEILQTRFFKKK